MQKVKTTGQFRDFLMKTIEEVRGGALDVQSANSISKLAAQVNENFYAEIKTAKHLMSVAATPPTLGDLQIGNRNSH